MIDNLIGYMEQYLLIKGLIAGGMAFGISAAVTKCLIVLTRRVRKM